MDNNNNLNNEETKPVNSNINGMSQIAGAILVVGIMISGAILLKDSNAGGGTTQGGRKLNPSTAKVIGLNTKEFAKCLEADTYNAKVQADVDDGKKAQVNGTPTSFILKNGVVVDVIGGAQPIEKVNEQIKNARASSTSLSVNIRPVDPTEHILGNMSGDIVIVEYSDLECPFCKNFHGTMHQVIDTDPNVAWVYRHYPIPQLHQKAFKEAVATECAWAQGGNDAFWKYTDMIYKITPSNDGLEVAEL